MKHLTPALILISLCVTFCFLSCSDDTYDDFPTERTNASVLAGEWNVRSFDDSGQAITTYFDLSTFNTAANTAEIWLDDDSTIHLKAKAQGDLNSLTFTAMDTENFDPTDDDTPEQITITDGRIIKNAARSAVTRTPVDSIIFSVSTSIAPSTSITIAGHRVTGFLEDEL